MSSQISAWPETQWVRHVAQGDHDAFIGLHARYSKPLYSCALRVLNDPKDAEDVLQEVFLQVWEKAASFDEAVGNPFSWLVAMTRNKAIDHLRSKQRRAEIFTQAPESGDGEETAAGSQPAWGGQPEARIRTALNKLPDEQRRAIEMAFLAGLTHHEIAEALGEPLGTIKARIRRGMLRLRVCLRDEV